jgi:hypothetical protein
MCLPLQNLQAGTDLAKPSETRITYEPMLPAGLFYFYFIKSKQTLLNAQMFASRV